MDLYLEAAYELRCRSASKEETKLVVKHFGVSGLTLLAAAESFVIFRRTVNLARWPTLPRQRD